MIVLSLGGSTINPGKPDVSYIRKLASLLVKLNKREPIAIVVGGGSVARDYAKAARELGANEFLADETAVISTHQNAMLLVCALGESAYPRVPRDFEQAAEAALLGKIVVMGGTIPGITTDGDSALLAEKLGARRLVNISNVSGIFDSDPRKNKNAKKLARMDFAQLIELANCSDDRKAGTNFVFDLFACKIIARSRIETHFVSGKELNEVEKAIKGEKHGGSIVGE
ncbi:MAG: UMP kinase [Candidatus Micrarchaeota archaeon]